MPILEVQITTFKSKPSEDAIKYRWRELYGKILISGFRRIIMGNFLWYRAVTAGERSLKPSFLWVIVKWSLRYSGSSSIAFHKTEIVLVGSYV